MRKPSSGIRRRIVCVVVVFADVDVDVTRLTAAVAVVAVSVDVVALQSAVGSGCRSVIPISGAQVEQESGAGTAERTSGTVAACRGTVVIAARAADIAAGVVRARIVFAVEGGRDENSATRFSFSDWGFWRWLRSFFCRR